MLLPSDFLLHNRYLIKSHIGQGGFGITYIAYDQQLAVQVCIKELYIDGINTRNSDMSVQSHSLKVGFSFQDFVERFLDEARQVARFRHPNIVRVTDVFKENNTAYMVMEYLNGDTLQALVKREGTLPESRALALLGQVLDAVEEVHKKGMLHRDIKPDNILVTKEGQVVLIDFGSAREFAEGKTTAQTAMITHGYAPTEQYSDRRPRGPYTDVYAIGATLYFILTGEKPLSVIERMHEVLPSPHQLNTTVSESTSRVIMKAMAMNSEDRYQNVGDLREAIYLLQEKSRIEIIIYKTLKKVLTSNTRKRGLAPVLIGSLVIVVAVWVLFGKNRIAELATSETKLEYTEFTSVGGLYVPVGENQKALSFQLTYFHEADANKPTCSIVFSDEFEIFTNATCPGDYSWCLLNGESKELGSMKLQFTADGTGAYIDIKESQIASRYKEYLSALSGQLTRIETAEQVLERIKEEKEKAEQLAEQQRLAAEAEQLAEQQRREAEAEQKRLEEEERKRKEAIESQRSVSYSTARDIQGQVYKTVTIGNQVWMAENLNVSTFRNGNLIPETKSAEEWQMAGENRQPAWCYYDNNPANASTYGKLYNWYVVSDQRGICPIGWHVPLDEEWNDLTNYLGSEDSANKIKSNSGWAEYGNGTNSSGFSGFPGGARSTVGYFADIAYYGAWWSIDESSISRAWTRYVHCQNEKIFRNSGDKAIGLSVRCLKD